VTATRSEPFPRRSRIAALAGMLGVLVLVASAALVIWLAAVAKAPGLDRLEQVTGHVKSATTSGGHTTGRMLKLVVTTDGADYELTLPHIEQLPVRDWPLESINPGAPVVAWYIPVQGTKFRGALWQLHRGRQRVVALEDTGALYREWVRNTLSWCALGLLSGAVLIAAGFGGRNGGTPAG
jgi:hypothetical protein